MREVRMAPLPRTTESEPEPAQSALLLADKLAPAQSRREFDAAIRRASGPEEDATDDTEESAAFDGAENLPGMLPHWIPLPAVAGHGGQACDAWQGGGSVAGHAAVSHAMGASVTFPDAVPMAAHTVAAGAGQQMRLQIPMGGAEAATLALRLAQTSAGQWQLRVGGDAAVRQQLAPHMDRLRDRLRERGQTTWDDLGFDDDNGN